MNNLERLFFYYFAGRPFIPLPRYLIYNATRRCDLRCQHCGIWQGPKRKELKPDELWKITSQKFFRKIDTVWFTGGEPTLRKDLPELVRVLSRSLPQVRMFGIATNGYASERILNQLERILAELDLTRQGLFVQISLDGIGETVNQIRRQEHAFEGILNTVSGFHQLKRKYPRGKIELGFNCVVQKANVRELNKVEQFAKEQKASLTFNLVAITDQYYCNQQWGSGLALNDEEKLIFQDFLVKMIAKSTSIFRGYYQVLLAGISGKARSRRCLSLYSSLIIDADGTWIPCPLSSEWMRMNFLEIDLAQFWKSKETQDLRRKIEKELCPKCMLSCSLGDSLSLREFLAGGF